MSRVTRPALSGGTQRAQRSEKFSLARNFQSRSKISISTSRFPHKNRAAVGGSLENFTLARNYQSCSKSRICLFFGPSGYGLAAYGIAIFQSPKNIFQEAEICRKIPEIPQKERFLAKFPAPKFENSEPHPAAKGVRQKELGKKVTKKVTEASEKVTESVPKTKKVIELLLPRSFCGTLRARKNAIPYPQPFHTPTRLPPR